MLTAPQPGLTPTLTLTQVAAGESFCLIATSHVDNLTPSSDFCRYLSCRGQPALNGQIIGLLAEKTFFFVEKLFYVACKSMFFYA